MGVVGALTEKMLRQGCKGWRRRGQQGALQFMVNFGDDVCDEMLGPLEVYRRHMPLGPRVPYLAIRYTTERTRRQKILVFAPPRLPDTPDTPNIQPETTPENKNPLIFS